jgi:hypothetical protein
MIIVIRLFLPIPVHAFLPISSFLQKSNFIISKRTVQTLSIASHSEESKAIDTWVSHTELQRLSNDLDSSCKEISSLHADVSYYPDVDSSTPSIYRLNKYSKLLQLDDSLHSKASISDDVQQATDSTIRWCSDFVQELNLCPWAKISLQSKNAIRIKIIHQISGLKEMERIIRESAKELIWLTDEESGDVDINAGITFIVALPRSNGKHRKGFQFQNFYDFSTELEDKLFDEADEVHDAIEAGSVDLEDENLIGDEITLAPFHPDWSFAGTSGENPLDYEKKSPYPTISLVRTSVIERAGEEATNKIAVHNEEVLQDFGAKKLQTFYAEKVLQKFSDIP